MAVHVSNHQPDAVTVQTRWRVSNCAGKTLREGGTAGNVRSQANVRLEMIDCRALREAGGTARLPTVDTNAPMEGDRDLLFWVEALVEGQVVSRNLATFAKPKHLCLKRPTIIPTIAPTEQGVWRVTLASDRAAPWTRLAIEGVDATWSDNFLHLDAESPRTVAVQPQQSISTEVLKQRLWIEPVVDLWDAGAPGCDASHT
ncbi:MAG: glycoside hydrolase family 2 protein [Phycisphaeraceae bacterium]